MCKQIASWLLVIVNILFLLIASALIIVGALLQWGGSTIQTQIIPGLTNLITNGNKTLTITDLSVVLNQYAAVLGNAGLIIFIIGIILFVICICGTCGVCCKQRILMIIYLIFVLVIWILIVIFIIVFFTQKTQMETQGGIAYMQFLQSNYIFNNGSYASATTGLQPTGIVDLIQARAMCCGSTNYTDFFLNRNYNASVYVVPYSCCKMTSPSSFTPIDSNCTQNPTANNSYLNNGCYTFLWGLISTYSNYAAYGLIGLGILLLILIIIAGILQKSYRESSEKA